MTAKERILELIRENRAEITEVVREHGLCHGQALCVEFNERAGAPDHVVHIASAVYLTRQASRINHKVYQAFLRARYGSKPGRAPVICLYMPRPGDVACAVMVLDLQRGAEWPKLTRI